MDTYAKNIKNIKNDLIVSKKTSSKQASNT